MGITPFYQLIEIVIKPGLLRNKIIYCVARNVLLGMTIFNFVRIEMLTSIQ